VALRSVGDRGTGKPGQRQLDGSTRSLATVETRSTACSEVPLVDLEPLVVAGRITRVCRKCPTISFEVRITPSSVKADFRLQIQS
jgi:hypothetical protein